MPFAFGRTVHFVEVNGWQRSGRAEPTTQVIDIFSVVAARSTSLKSMDGKEVDVPRFELGASTMPR